MNQFKNFTDGLNLILYANGLLDGDCPLLADSFGTVTVRTVRKPPTTIAEAVCRIAGWEMVGDSFKFVVNKIAK